MNLHITRMTKVLQPWRPWSPRSAIPRMRAMADSILAIWHFPAYDPILRIRVDGVHGGIQLTTPC